MIILQPIKITELIKSIPNDTFSLVESINNLVLPNFGVDANHDIDKIYDILTLPEPFKDISKDKPCINNQILPYNSRSEFDNSLYCCYEYNKYTEIINSDKEYNLDPEFNTHLAFIVHNEDLAKDTFIKGAEYLPLLFTCTKLDVESNVQTYDYHITTMVIADDYKSNSLQFISYNTFLYNSRSRDILILGNSHCKSNCSVYNSDAVEHLTEDFFGFGERKMCKYCDKCGFSYYNGKPENVIRLFGYIQYLIENRHRTSKMPEYTKLKKNPSILGVEFSNKSTESPSQSNSNWITIKELADNEKITKRYVSYTGEHLTHNSPCEHYRKSHTRTLKNGRIVQVRGTTVNKGNKKKIYDVLG